ncbi:hypothetical protein [Paenibacillus humicus]|uniref:hypothetical protein n=1 Tax=Paenibacillus humicus TaxID=412861 RepID=UPI003F1700BB
MLCPNDHMVMNHTEADGISIHKCPVCGSVRLSGHEEDKLAFGGVELYPCAPKGAAETTQEAPFGASDKESSGRSSHESIDIDALVYGAPESGNGSFDCGRYGYVPEDVQATDTDRSAAAYGMPPEDFGRVSETERGQAAGGSYAYQPVPSKI